MRFVAPLCAAVVLFGASCEPRGEIAVKDSVATAAPPVLDVAAVKQAIEQADTKFSAALMRGDSAGIVRNYSEDAIVMLPGMPAWRGRTDIIASSMKLVGSITFSDAKFSAENIDVAGDFAIETGTYHFMITPKGGKPSPDKGKYVSVWKKQADGSWKLYRDISNSDTSPK